MRLRPCVSPVLLFLTLAALVACQNGGAAGAVAGSRPPAAGASPTTAPARAGFGVVPGHPSAAPAPCTVFPADNVWHADVSRLPVARDSAAYVASIGAGAAVHADFGAGMYGGGPIGIPVTTVASGTPGVRVTFQYADESDRGPYPVPRGARIEGGPAAGGDRHVILYDPAACRAYELYAAYPNGDGSWRAGSGAIFDLRSDTLRPAGWTSADAAGLSILAGLVRYDEVAAGHIDHAIRMTVPRSAGYIWPARHQTSPARQGVPPMGLRLRLKSTVDISRLPAQARIVAQAMQRYGVIVADNGSPWYLSGVPDDRWSNDALHALGTLHGSDFEVVDESGLMRDAASALVLALG